VVSFRFHLVSLVAIFLALGLGVLAGTTVINRGIVTGLEQRTDDLSGELATVRDDVDRLQSEQDVWEAFGQEAVDPLLAGRLADTRVVLIAQDGTDDASIDGVLGKLRASTTAPDEVIGPIIVSGRMALDADADRAELARIVGSEAADEPDQLLGQAADLLAERLAFGPAGNQTLEDLLAAGFLVDEGQRLDDAEIRSLGGAGQVVVTLAGGPAPSPLSPERFLVPLVAGLSRMDAPVAAAEPVDGEEQEPPFVQALRSDGDVWARIATQDNVDETPGQIGLVLAVEDLLQGLPGHYGVKDGATRPIPEL
jgi:copper transport outer membrane protein MctB